MNKKKVVSVYSSIIGEIEAFSLDLGEYNPMVIYSYYDKDWNLLYIGRSKHFYDAHYLNSNKLNFFNEVKYVGFLYVQNDTKLTDNQKRYFKNNPEALKEDFIVNRMQMEKRWKEFLDEE